MKKVFWILFVLTVLFVVPVAFAQGEEPPVDLPEITAAFLALNIAAGMSLLFDYAPFLATWYDGLNVATKRVIALVVAVVIVAAVFGLQCAGVVNSNLTCSRAGAFDALSNIVLVFAVGQGVHAGTKPTPAFKAKLIGASG